MSITDKTVVFDIKSKRAKDPHRLDSLPTEQIEKDVHWNNGFDGRLEETRQQLNAVKSQLDEFEEKSYYAARDSVFSLASSGSQGSTQFFNRAGFKLNESMQAVGVWEHTVKIAKQRNWKRIAFADVCGGPGAFSQALYATCPKYFSALLGFGMTLLNDRDGTLQWYPSLVENRNFVVTYGTEGTGNIYATENIHSLMSLVSPSPLLLVVADGGFDVPFDIANFQETISLRIVYGQWLAAVATLKEGGSFVLKLFDTFAPFTRSLLYLSTLFYQSVTVVKPKHSRVVNSERYLVCVGFRGISKEWLSFLLDMHEKDFSENTAPRSVVPMSWMESDDVFTQSVDALNETVASNQMIALRMVLASPLLKKKPSSSSAVVEESEAQKAEMAVK